MLEQGNIVIAAGFQGIDENLNITTLGRGGSDTTAVALAAVLGADQCEIYTDVDGIYTTDPRLLPEATLMHRVCYDEMLELASLGAGVMHSRSIEFGKKFNVPIHVRSSLSDGPGSLIVDHADSSDMVVSGAALTRDEALVSVVDVPDVAGTILKIFAPIAEAKITVDMIVQNVADDGTTTISFTVPRGELETATRVVTPVVEEMGGKMGASDENVSKISVVGLGMANESGVADRMFRVLADAGINLGLITTSEIKISVLVSRDQSVEALRKIHSEFGLDQPRAAPAAADAPSAPRDASPLEVLKSLQDMEGLTIDEVSLDSSQSRVTVSRIPNKPGLAAMLFETVAAADVFVDMIVQSWNSEQIADITFTVPRDQLDAALKVSQAFCAEHGGDCVNHKKEIAKLSVSGVGLRSHTGVAIGMFAALSDAGINIEMVNTSEVRVNVVVDGSDGESGMKRLRETFLDS